MDSSFLSSFCIVLAGLAVGFMVWALLNFSKASGRR
jgi:hypothetical protein